MAYTLPMARPLRTCWKSRLRVIAPTAAPVLPYVDPLPAGAALVHLDLGHVRLLLHDLPARRGLEGDLPQRGIVGAGHDLLVELHPQRGQVHLGQRWLLVERAQRFHEDLDAAEGLGAE